MRPSLTRSSKPQSGKNMTVPIPVPLPSAEPTYYTVVLKYENNAAPPPIGAGTTALGGQVVAVQFNDALEENARLLEQIEEYQEAQS